MRTYNKESYEWAKKVLLPSIVEAEKGGVKFNLPDVLKMCASELLTDYNKLHEQDYIRDYAFSVMSTFSESLHTEGFYEFGDMDIMELIPDKYL